MNTETPQNWFAPFDEPLLKIGGRHLRGIASRGGVILDLGCGRGHRTASLEDLRGACLVGLDIDREALTAAFHQFPSNRYLCADIAHLPIRDSAVDAVFSFSVLQYVDWRRAIRDCRRILKPGGRVTFIENLEDNLLVKSYRAAHKLMRWRYGRFMKPREHLRWEDLEEFREVFERVRVYPFHMTAPVALIWPVLRARLTHSDTVIRPGRIVNALRRLDQFLFKRFDFLNRGAWMVVICAERSPAPEPEFRIHVVRSAVPESTPCWSLACSDKHDTVYSARA